MTEQEISTTSTNVETQTTPAPVEPQTIETAPAETETKTADDVQPAKTEQEPEKTSVETETKTQDWEKIAKDNQASFTKVSQEKAELAKKIEELEQKLSGKPKIVDDKGKMTPEFERNYKFQADNREFLAYDNLSRQLDHETRDIVEGLLNEAKALYNPNNKNAYNLKMKEIKDYFTSDIVEQIALDRKNFENQMTSEFDKALAEDRQKRAVEVETKVAASEVLKPLLHKDSESYSEDTFAIIKQMFDLTGGVDVNLAERAVKSIKELAVKEYLANESAKKEAEMASVPTATAPMANVETGLPTREQLVSNKGLYREAVKKYGMEKIDAIVMKG